MESMKLVSALAIGIASPLAAYQTAQSSGTTAEFRGLHAPTASIAWASGRNGVYSRTTDGGTTWRADSIPGAQELFLVDVHARSAEVACVLGTSFDGGLARVYRTTDGGGTWEIVFEDQRPGVFYDGLAFWDDDRGAAFSDPVEDAFVIVRTTDGCATWEPVAPADLPPPLAGEAGFAASGTAIATAGDGLGWIGTGGGTVARVLRTSDYGATWTAHETPMPGGPTAGIFGIAFRDPMHGVAVGGDYRQRSAGSGNVLHTEDGGRTWRVAGTSAPPGVRYGVAYVPDGTGLIATGPSGFGYSDDDGATWTAIDTVNVNTVAIGSPEVAWVAGVEGRVWRLIPRGTTARH